MMNLVFRCMPQDKPGQPHDYAAERKRNDRRPPRPLKGVTVRLGELDGLSAEFIQKRDNQGGTILYIHGGGFTVGSARERRADDLEYLRQPTISPLYGDFSGLPPVFFSASDTEVLLDDSKVLYEKLKKQGHQTALDIQHGVCHERHRLLYL